MEARVSRPRIVVVTTMVSPFQNDMAHAILARGDVDYHIVYTITRETQYGENHRGKHWTAEREQADFIHERFDWRSPAELARALDPLLTELAPDILIGTGVLRSATYRALQRLSPALRRVPTGYWLEHPNLAVPLAKRVAMEAVIRYQLRQMDFLLAIGDRAQGFYQRCRRDLPVHNVPYGQDLSHHFAVPRGRPNDPVRFVFSGQLLPRNNIANLVAALRRLADSHPRRWTLVVAANGPEEPRVRALEARTRRAGWESVEWDRTYETWLDRIRPLATSDVLVCPSVHAGWALVVPEAMAAGMPVIATRYVGAARYFLRPEVNGLSVRPDVDSIYRALRRFVEDPAAIPRMGAAAREAARAGTAEHVSGLFVDAVLGHVQG
jgi:glycosyltransferase involved in cell wall biosynthesis